MKMTSSPISGWQAALMQAMTDPEELLTFLELDRSLLTEAKKAAALFPFKVPRGFADRMQKGNPHDPLLLQVLPLGAECEIVAGYDKDPLHELAANPIPGLLHKYQNRVLLTFVTTCGVNCRYCFRREFPYAENNPGTAGWDQALDYIAKNPLINEVILSGGDPLVASDKLLRVFSDKLNAIPHVKRLRIHSRMPIVLPERITQEFIEWITKLQQKPILVVHCNHPQEINSTVSKAMQALHQAGVTLLNQSVLLKDVNDNVDILVKLSEDLFAIGVQPYYLHILDKVNGTAHFDLKLEEAKALHWGMSQCLSGYLVPKLVYEKPGAPAKICIA